MRIVGESFQMDGSSDPFVRAMFMTLTRQHVTKVELTQMPIERPEGLHLKGYITFELYGTHKVAFEMITSALWHLTGQMGELEFAHEAEILEEMQDLADPR